MQFHGEPEIQNPGRSNDSSQTMAGWPARKNPDLGAVGIQRTPLQKLTDVVKLFENQYQDPNNLQHSYSQEEPAPWSNITLNKRFIGHLFDLYFTWVHPFHMLFSESDFKNDFHSNQQTNCSAPLVNAICAMSCNLLEKGYGHNHQKTSDIAILRDGFMDEARKLLLPNSYSWMTSKQTFAVMFMVEMSSGKARSAMGYLRSAIDNEKFRESTQHSEATKELTLWGIQTLNS